MTRLPTHDTDLGNGRLPWLVQPRIAWAPFRLEES